MKYGILALSIGFLLSAGVAAQAAPPPSMPGFLGAQIFYDNGFLGQSVVLAIVDRGWIDRRRVALKNVTEFLSWVGLPNSGLRVPTQHETAVAGAAAALLPTFKRGIAPEAELWSETVKKGGIKLQ